MEIGWFIILPVVREIMAVYTMRDRIRINRFSLGFAALLLTAALLVVWPRPHSYLVPAVVEAEQLQLLYAPFSGMITSLEIRRGDAVHSGQRLVSMASAELNAAVGELQIQEQIDSTELELLFLQNTVARIPEKTQQKLETESRLASLKRNAEQYQVRAAIDGLVAEWDKNLKPGMFAKKDQVFGRIIDPRHVYLVAYIPEAILLDPEPGDTVLFYPADGSKSIAGTIRKINNTAATEIPYAALTSEQQGDIPVVAENGRLVPLEARYLVEVTLEKTDFKVGQSGALRMKTKPGSTLVDLWNRAYRIMIRESNF
ncbi:MAG: hypothetical protein CSA26_12815 [Desulfobacterales bacterium]|nr:MAG: hypothetical protein CSA26_12815 [Desulfobacterales bacterium]